MFGALREERAGRYNSLRLLGHDYSNTDDEYFITITTNARNPFFADIVLAKQITSLILDMHDEGKILLFAYVLMPDHFHALLKIGNSMGSLPLAIGYFKGKATRLYWKRARQVYMEGRASFYGKRSDEDELRSLRKWSSFAVLPEVLKIENLRPPALRIFQSKRLWQEGYHDHVIRSKADFNETLEYILENPVLRGYVPEPWMYPFSGVISE